MLPYLLMPGEPGKPGKARKQAPSLLIREGLLFLHTAGGR